jgi:hypothetical protein
MIDAAVYKTSRTTETILRMIERKYGKARRIWGFDRGIVSEENLASVRKRLEISDGHAAQTDKTV